MARSSSLVIRVLRGKHGEPADRLNLLLDAGLELAEKGCVCISVSMAVNREMPDMDG